jgi:HK97 family phage portal protein
MNNSVLGLDLPTFAEIRAERQAATKSVPFPAHGSSGPFVIYPTMNDWQHAIAASLSGGTQPSSDPSLSSLVAAGYTWLGSTLPEPDLQVKKEFLRKRGGKKQDDNVIERHAIYPLLKRPNRQNSGSNLWRAFARSWIIDGNAYWLKRRNKYGQVVEIRNEPHENVKVRWVNDQNGEYIDASRSMSVPVIARSDSPTEFINYYELIRDNRRYRVEPDDVVHFRDGEDPTNRRYGLSRLKTITREVFGDSAVASYAANLLGGNGVVPYVVGIDDKDGLLSQEDLDTIKAKLIEQTTGRNAGQGLVLSARASFNRTGLTPQEMDLRSTRYMAQEMFSAVTGIPSIVLNFGAGMERSIWNNMSEADRRAIDSYLQPLWWHIAQELTNQLLPDFDQDSSHFLEFDLSEVGALQEDENAKVDRIAKLYETGIIRRAEARTEMNYETDPDGADDVYFVRSGSAVVSLEEEEEMRMQALEPPEPPVIEGELVEDEPKKLALVKSRMLKGAPDTVKQLYSAK